VVAAAEERRVTSLNQAPPDQIGRGFLLRRKRSGPVGLTLEETRRPSIPLRFRRAGLLEAVISLSGASRKEGQRAPIASGLRPVLRVGKTVRPSRTAAVVAILSVTSTGRAAKRAPEFAEA